MMAVLKLAQGGLLSIRQSQLNIYSEFTNFG